MIDAMTYLRLEVETLPPAGQTKNLVKNPNGAYGGFFWVTPTGGVVATSATLAGFLRYTHSGGGTGLRTERMPVTPGQYVSARWKLSASAGVTVVAAIQFEDASGALLSVTADSPAYSSAPTTERTYGPFVVPANAVSARLLQRPTAIVVGNVVELADVGFVCRTSASAVVWATDVAPGPTWLNILGPAVEIEVDRQALDLGTLSATIRDSTLDPLTATTIRPGRACRLTALTVAGIYDSVFEGELTEFDVDYDAEVLARRPGDPKHCKITLDAIDRTRTLASVRRPEGVSTLLDLRDTLEDAGVPWSINGNDAHTGAAPTVISFNENATALDQVALTRDSRGAHAWVDRRGILQVWDRTVLAPFLNTGFDVDLTGWVGAGGTRTWVAAPAATATPGAMQIVSLGAAFMTAQTSPMVRVIPGHVYTVSVRARAAAALRDVRVDLLWRDRNGNAISTTAGVNTPTVAGAWTTHTTTVNPSAIPVNAKYLFVTVRIEAGAAAGETFWIDDLQGINGDVVLDESVWTGVKIGGGSRQTINEVTVDYLRYLPAAGTEPAKTEVIPYGPYRNETSIAENGVRPRKFTIHGTNEAADVAAFAATVLAANGSPKVSVSEVTLPVKAASDIATTRALGDLQQAALVSFATKGYAERLRITGVRHVIRSDAKYKARWLVTYSFEATSTVAAPRAIPRPPQEYEASSPWIDATYINGWQTFAGNPVYRLQYRKIDGIVYVRGVVVPTVSWTSQWAVLPVGYRPAQDQWRFPSLQGAADTVTIGEVLTAGGIWTPSATPTRNGIAVGYVTINTSFPADA